MIKGRKHHMARVKSVICASVTLILLNGLPTFLALPAVAQTPSEALVPQSEVSREVARATFVSAATLAAIQRQSDIELRRQLSEIEELRAEVVGLRTSGAAETAALQQLRDTLAQREAAFVAELAEKDRAYAEEIATYRRAVEDIAATPEGLAALVRFNDGDEAGALAVLDQLRAARDLAAARRIAQLALDARNRGAEGVRTADVIAYYAEITRLDPEAIGDWVELGRLYVDAGDLPRALVAARQAEAAASNDRDRSIALSEIGDVLREQGDLSGALASYRESLGIVEDLVAANPGNQVFQSDLSVLLDRVSDILRVRGDLPEAMVSYQRSLDIRERLALTDPGNVGWQSDLSVSLERVGNVLWAQGDLPGALASYQRSLAIMERLAAADPGNAGWQHDLAAPLNKIGDVLRAQGDLPGALASYQRTLAIMERLAAADSGNAGWVRGLSVSLNKVGDVRAEQGDLPGALESHQRSLAIRERLAASDPGNAGWQSDLSLTLNRVGDVQVALGDLSGALETYRDSLGIAERLVAIEPDNAEWQRDVFVVLWRIRQLPEAGVTWSDIVNRMEAMEANGTLLPADRQYLDQARAEAEKENQ